MLTSILLAPILGATAVFLESHGTSKDDTTILWFGLLIFLILAGVSLLGWFLGIIWEIPQSD
jgi:hypothetical protein